MQTHRFRILRFDLRLRGQILSRLAAGLALGMVLTSCACHNVNPASPRSHKGYLDFYAEPAGPLSWRVERIDPRSGEAHKLFEQYAPLDDPVLRLELKPGTYHLRLSFLNLVTQAPAEAVVEVQAGEITPVKINLIETGTVLVESKETRAGGTYYGRFGRSTKLRDNETPRYEVRATPEPAEAYRPKSAMPYDRPDSGAK